MNVFFFFAVVITMSAADWPQFLGPGRDGAYPGTLAGRNAVQQWKVAVGAGFAGPAIVQGRVILFHRVRNKETVEALDAKTGKRVWVFDYDTTYRDDFGFDEGPRAAPVVAGGKVYTHGAEGMLTCLDFTTGRKVWQVDTRTQFRFPKGFFGAAAAPLVEGDKVILNVGGAQGIVAFQKDTGKVLWNATSDEAGYSSPMAATIHGQRHVLVLTRAALVSLDPASGAVRFRLPWRSRNDASVNAAVPLVIGDLVFVSASYRTGATVLQIAPGGTSYKQLWSGDESLSNHYATSVHKDGYLYGYHGRQENGQTLRCVELRSGKVMWEVEDFGAGTVTLVGSDLMLVREGGELAWYAANPKGPAKAVGPRKQLLPGVVRAYPALADEQLCVRNTDTLACFAILQ
jgi:outer membrane protein assembly factor BamB